MANIKNIYEFLGEKALPVTETSLEKVIAAIKKKIAYYNSDFVTVEDAVVKADRKKELEMLKEQFQANPNLILQHAAAYKVIIEQKLKSEAQVLPEKLRKSYFVTGNTISQKKLEQIAKELKLPEDFILKTCNLRVKAEKKFVYKDDNTPLLDLEQYKKIVSYLVALQHKTIYDFLELKQSVSLIDINLGFDKVWKSVSESSNVTSDHTLSVKKELCQLCKGIFKTEEGRKSYDKRLETEGFIEVQERIQNFKKFSTESTISPQIYKDLLSACTKNGIGRDKAEYLIYTTAQKFNLVIDEGGTDEMPVCRYCGTINDSSSVMCRECGMPVVVKCPSCGKESASDDLTCTHCGFSLIGMKDAPIYLKMAQTALESNNIEDAEKHYASAHNAWPTYQQLVSLRDQINKQKVNVIGIQKEIEAQCKKKNYYAANRNISALPISSPIRREIESAVNLAESSIKKAEEETDPNKRLDYYIQALNACADCSVAKEKMRTTPLAAPTTLNAEAEGNYIRLKWQKTGSNYISYLIVRKENSQPQNSNDGERIGETINASFDDLKASAGISYFYAVFSKYEEFISSKSAVTDKPVMRVEELNPQQIKVVPTEKSLEFTFNASKGVHSIEIYRDNEIQGTINGNSFIDNGLICEKNYKYRFVAIYRDILGNTHKSAGIELAFSPIPQLEVINLNVEENAGNAEIKWIAPKVGTLYIFYSDKPFTYNSNDIISIDSFRAQRLNVSGTSAVITKDFSGERYYLPVVFKGNVGVVGKGISIVSIAQLRDTNISHTEKGINVKWQWDKARVVRLHYRIDGTVDKKLDFSYDKGDKAEYTIPTPKTALSVEVSICSVVLSNGKELLGEPVREVITLQASRVEFCSAENKKHLFFASNDYILSFKAQSALPCDLHVIAKEQLPPIDLVNYVPLTTIKSADVQPNQITKVQVHYERKKKGEKLYFRLVAADRQAAKKIIFSPEMQVVK